VGKVLSLHRWKAITELAGNMIFSVAVCPRGYDVRREGPLQGHWESQHG